jgi:hypothetical protein
MILYIVMDYFVNKLWMMFFLQFFPLSEGMEREKPTNDREHSSKECCFNSFPIYMAI